MSSSSQAIILALSACALAGCASIISGPTQEVSFRSSPEDALVTVVRHEGEDEFDLEDRREVSRVLGKTPLTVQLDREAEQTVVFSKEGYQPVSKQLTTTLNPWFLGNILLGGFFGSTTDGLSGAVNEYSPSQFLVTLVPVAGSPVENAILSSQREKARVFIISRFNYLLTDLGKGNGEDLQTTMSLLSISAEDTPAAHRKMRALLEVYPDAGDFADHLTKLYLK